MQSVEQSPEALKQRYLMIMHVPYYVDDVGAVWLDRIWHRDFIEHLTYIQHMLLLAPRRLKQEGEDLVRVDPPPGVTFEVREVPPQTSMARALINLPATFATFWRAASNADIVHSNIAGWPFPLGWIMNPIALLRGRKLVLVVESATWRLTGSEQDDWKRRVRSLVYERVARFCVERADLTVCTQPTYRDSLFVDGRGRAVVIPATWINAEDVLDQDQAEAAWREKLARRVFRVLLPARLTADKGIHVLIDAIRRLDEAGVELELGIIGAGALRERCVELARSTRSVQVSVLETVPYGPAFFELLREYETVLVPNLGDEQPRIIFDAYSQAVAVIASDTPGTRPCIEDGQTGRIVPRGDAEALAEAIRSAAAERETWRRMGLAALAEARRHTHRAMHHQRWNVLLECFGSG
jgi:glycosyltransferase involved in cell wall biosynthesis